MSDPLLYRQLLRPLLFLLPPETAHELTLRKLAKWGEKEGKRERLKKWYAVEDDALERECFGLRFPNPLGVAAGLDKNAEAWKGLGAVGFGFVEIGTVTPRPQKGNPKPRLFRLPSDRALVNRMGFNNVGVDRVVEHLSKREEGPIVGANIGKNKDTPNEKAYEDLQRCFDALHPVADYLVVNVSSPNTPGLRELQEKDALRDLLKRLLERREALEGKKPLLLKLAPDLGDEALDEAADVALESGIDGLIVSNTTISRESLRSSPQRVERIGAGGLSGAPLKEKAERALRKVRERTGPDFPIIGVGGIMNGSDALERLKAGADLIQVYTGLIYEGPGLVKSVLSSLRMEK